MNSDYSRGEKTDKEMNEFQKEFMETISAIQETCVQIALSQENNGQRSADELYNITSEVIIKMMEVIDGYANPALGRLAVICEKTGESLKENPYIELHDIVCDYLKEAD